MGIKMRRSVQDKVCIVTFLALLMLHRAEEHEYFVHDGPATWDQARSHCQLCFKELVTLTPNNIQTIVSNLSAHYWVGLRKNLSSTGRGLHIPWSLWANGDPLTFQNWYPGWPAKAEELSCKGETGTTGATTAQLTTETSLAMSSSAPPAPTGSAPPAPTGSAPPAPTGSAPPAPTDSVYHPVYIEDSCVAMASFGAWIEKECSERLPYICYEEYIYSNATVSRLTSSSATLSWSAGPGSITHYRVEVNASAVVNRTDLTFDLVGLTAGDMHSVQVFAVKCNRDLNPQKVVFYTIPNKIESVIVTNVTKTSVRLHWAKPAGKVGFYEIEVLDRPDKLCIDTEGTAISDLKPGGMYTLNIRTTVADGDVRSEAETIVFNTKPEKVSNLKVSKNTNNSLQLDWVPPEGGATHYWVEAWDNGHRIFSSNTSNRSETVARLPMGTNLTLGVRALAHGVVGERVTVIGFTAPGPISNLLLPTTAHSLVATWDPPKGNYTYFSVKIRLLDGKGEERTFNVKETTKSFDDLQTAANYTVTVYTVSGKLRGPPFSGFNVTLPKPPRNVKVVSSNKSHISLQWEAPSNAATSMYLVNIHSDFWESDMDVEVDNQTTITVGGLTSGSRYHYAVQTVVGSLKSESRGGSNFTDSELRDVSLSMLCSSKEPLFCDKDDTKKNVLAKLRSHFYGLLRDNIVWELDWREP